MKIKRCDNDSYLTLVKPGTTLIVKADKATKMASFKLTYDVFKELELFAYEIYPRLDFDPCVPFKIKKLKGISIKNSIVTFKHSTAVKNICRLTLLDLKSLLELSRQNLKTEHLERQRLNTAHLVTELEHKYGKDCWLRSDDEFLNNEYVKLIRGSSNFDAIQLKIRRAYLKCKKRDRILKDFKNVWNDETLCKILDLIDEELKDEK